MHYRNTYTKSYTTLLLYCMAQQGSDMKDLIIPAKFSGYTVYSYVEGFHYVIIKMIYIRRLHPATVTRAPS